MSEGKTGIGKLIAKIGDFFEGLFNAAQKAWNKLNPEVQEAMEKGSEILAIINKNVTEAPEFVIDIIEKTTGVDREKLLWGLNKVSEGLNVAEAIEAESLEDTIKNLQVYLESLQGGIWAGISSFSAKLLAFAFAPEGTKWATLEALMEFTYHKIVKKD